MSDETSIIKSDDAEQRKGLEQVRSLGTSPMGECFEVISADDDDTLEEDSEVGADRFVLKKITRARLRSPERFRQKFDALCRLDHANLCPYRDLYVGEKATRITRDFVDGVALNDYLLQPITDEESALLAHRSEISDVDERSSTDEDEPSTPTPDDEGDGATEIDAPSNADADAGADTAGHQAATGDDSAPTANESHAEEDDEPTRPSTLEIPESLLEDSNAADRILDLIILRLQRLIPPLVDALEYLHRFRHVHGNLTPSNILVTEDEQVILTDYGLHPQLDIAADSRQRYPCYHAPEVEDGEYTAESDLYALGAILFEVIANCRYGERRRQETPTNSETTVSPIYLSEIVPHCPASWVDLIHALLASEPDGRPPLEDVHRQLAATEARSVNIPASVVQEQETLHGRSDSLDQLSEHAQICAQERTMGIAIVEGETGVGKTALLDALARRTAQRGWVVLHGRCFHRESVAFQGWEDIADRLAEILDDLPEKVSNRLAPSRHRAARLFPQLSLDEESPPDISRLAAIDGFRRLLRGLSEQRPLLICFDDIHWAGRDSTRLLADLAERPMGMRLMVVSSWRPDAATPDSDHPFWDEIATAPVEVDRISIRGFSKHEARDYVLTHGEHLSLRQKQEVLRRGGLNPLLIDELIYEFDETTQLSRGAGEPNGANGDGEANDGSKKPTDDKASKDGLDHYLSSFIEQRLTELSRTERLVIQLLTIASAPLSAPLLAQAMKRELGTQTADLVTGRQVAESLIERRLARRARSIDSSSEASARYVIIHDLCRRVVLNELGQDHHARLCGLIADSLAEGEKPSDDLRFEYLVRAGRHEEAGRAALLAARSALDRFAYHRSTLLWQWLSEADALNGDESASDDEALDDEDHCRFAAALLGANHFAEALEQLEQLPASDSPDINVQRQCDRVQALLSMGDQPGAIEAMDKALSLLSHRYQNRSLFALPSLMRRRVSSTIGRWSDATAIATDEPPNKEFAAKARLVDFALQATPFLIAEAQRPLEYRFASLALQDCSAALLARDRLWMVGDPWLPFLVRDGNKLNRWLDQASSLCEGIDDPEAMARTWEMKALLHRHRGELQAGIEPIDEAQRLLERGDICNPLLYARLQTLRIDHALWLGDVESVATIAPQSLHRFRHQKWLTMLAKLARCDRDLMVGKLDAVHRVLEDFDDYFGDDRNSLLHLLMMDRRTRFNIARGRPEVAVAQWDLLLDRAYGRSLRRLPVSRYLIHLNLARALAALAQRQRVLEESHRRESVRRLKRALRRLGDLEAWLGTLERARLHRLRSCFCLIQERPQRALRHVEAAIELIGDQGPPVVVAMNQEALGFVQHRLERPDARATLEQARAAYDDCGVYLPLVLEGWPVPRSHARLNEDP